jgi:hypothetical protein
MRLSYCPDEVSLLCLIDVSGMIVLQEMPPLVPEHLCEEDSPHVTNARWLKNCHKWPPQPNLGASNVIIISDEGGRIGSPFT